MITQLIELGYRLMSWGPSNMFPDAMYARLVLHGRPDAIVHFPDPDTFYKYLEYGPRGSIHWISDKRPDEHRVELVPPNKPFPGFNK